MIEHKIFIDRARYLQKPIPSSEEIDAALSTFNELEITNSHRGRLEVRVWDGISNVNNATPEYIRETNPWADKIYLILVDGRITYMQSHEPFVDGYVPMTLENCENIGNNHADSLAEDMAKNEIIQGVLSELGLTE
jgi:hypothetical protein